MEIYVFAEEKEMKRLLHSFLRDSKKNQALYNSYAITKQEKTYKELENEFEKYKLKINFISYIEKVITFTAYKHINKYKKRKDYELLSLNVTEQDFAEEKINTIPDDTVNFLDEIFNETEYINFRDMLENYNLLQAIENLTKKQQEIIYYTTIQGKTEKELSMQLNISQQAINKMKNKALTVLKETLLNDYIS